MLSAAFRPTKPSFLALFTLLFLFSAQANALPLAIRQAPGSQTQLTTTKETVTAAGTLIETCEITLTPIKDAAGSDAFEKVTKCTVQVRAGNAPGAPPISSASGATTETTRPSATAPSDSTASAPASTTAAPGEAPSASASGSASPVITIIPVSSSALSISGAPAQSTSEAVSSAVESASASAASSVDSASVSASSSAESASASPTASSSAIVLTPAAPTATNSAAPSVSATDVPSVSSSAESSAPSAPSSSEASSPEASSSAASEPSPTSSAVETPQQTAPGDQQQPPPAADNRGTDPSPTATPSDGTAAAAESGSATSEPFALPGKKLSVLPIGLGVFAGISVIALIVVGLVTYERTKYRRQFRKQKLAESAAPMGYSGGGYNSV